MGLCFFNKYDNPQITYQKLVKIYLWEGSATCPTLANSRLIHMRNKSVIISFLIIIHKCVILFQCAWKVPLIFTARWHIEIVNPKIIVLIHQESALTSLENRLYTLYDYDINYSKQTSSHISNESIPTLFLVSEPDLGALSVLKHRKRMMNNTGNSFRSSDLRVMSPARCPCAMPVKVVLLLFYVA